MSKLAHSNDETMFLIEAHRLAEHLGWQEAKRLAAAHKFKRIPVRNFYDQLAATCLGDLIYTRMRKKP